MHVRPWRWLRIVLLTPIMLSVRRGIASGAPVKRTVRLLVAAPSHLLMLETGLPAGLRMLDLAERYRLTARRIHDARYAATALLAGLYLVYTYDPDDWRVFAPDGLVIAGPPSVLVPGS